MVRARGSLLIAAISGRALARAACNAGYVPLVADFFADTDTRAMAHAFAKLQGDIADGIHWHSLEATLESLEKDASSPILGVVYGSGFEDRPQLLARIAGRWRLLGNPPDIVARLKEPRRFFALLDELGIPHPTTTVTKPREVAGWVTKRRGAGGGSHVQPLKREDNRTEDNRTDVYYQAFVPGRSISALFVGDGRDACVLGFSEQWIAPAPGKPWRYGGAMQPAAIPQEAATAMTDIVATLARACGLKGLASADFVLSNAEPSLLEVNPRPGATLDIFQSADDPLLQAHLEAVLHAKLPPKPAISSDGQASAILYATEPLTAPIGMAWPAWAADVPVPGERIDKQRPICTVLARAGSGAQTKELVETRRRSLLATIRKSVHASGLQEEQQGECKE